MKAIELIPLSKRKNPDGFVERLAVLENEVKHCNEEIGSMKSKLTSMDNKLDSISQKVSSKLGAKEWGAIITTAILAFSAIIAALLK